MGAARNAQRRFATGIFRVDIGARVDQPLGDRGIVPLVERRIHQRR